MIRPALAFLAAFILAFAAPSAATAQIGGPPDTSVLAASGVVFPERLGNFVRVGISSVMPGRIGGSYNLPPQAPGMPVADIFVAPVNLELAAELDNTEGLIAANFQNLKLIRPLRAPSGAPGAVGRLSSATLEGHPVLTGVILYHRRGWRIKVRATLDAARGEAGWAEVDKMLEAFDWNGPGA